MSIPKNQEQFGAGAISIKKNGNNFIALIMNAGIVDQSWSKLADNANIRKKYWWIFSIPVSNVQEKNKQMFILGSKVKAHGFNEEEKAVKKFDKLAYPKDIGEITSEVIEDKSL